MRFRTQESVYVYGVKLQPHFDRQVTTDNFKIRNYGIMPRDWRFEYDPRHDWYLEVNGDVSRKLIKSGVKKHRAYAIAWNMMNYHAHTIQLALKRYVAQKRNVQQQKEEEESEWTDLVHEMDAAVDSLREEEEEDAEWTDLVYEMDDAVDSLLDGAEEYYDWVDARLEEMFAYQEMDD